MPRPGEKTRIAVLIVFAMAAIAFAMFEALAVQSPAPASAEVSPLTDR